MEKLKLRNGKVPGTQCNFLSVNQLIFKLFPWAPQTDLHGPHIFLIGTFITPPLLYSTPKKKLNSQGFLKWFMLENLEHPSNQHYQTPIVDQFRKARLRHDFSMENNLLGRKWLFNSCQHPFHPQHTPSHIFSSMDQSSSPISSIWLYVIVSLLKGKFWREDLFFYSLAT